MVENFNYKEETAMTFTKVDRKASEIMQALAEAPLFKKQGQVKARPAVPGERHTSRSLSKHASCNRQRVSYPRLVCEAFCLFRN